MPQVLDGDQPGLTVADILRQVADALGYQPTQSRFANACKDWIQSTLLDIQLADPKMRRTVAIDCELTLKAGVDTYDVALDVDDGGFGWTNCAEVLRLKLDSYASPLEVVSMSQYRSRAGMIPDKAGPVQTVVLVDQRRVKIVPAPADDMTGVGDYVQSLPKLVDPGDKIEWPRAWDVVLLEGCLWRGYRWHSPTDSAWRDSMRVYENLKATLTAGDKATAVRPSRVVVTRALKRTRLSSLPNDVDRGR